MILYGIVILLCMALIAACDALFAPVPSTVYCIVATAVGTAAVILLDGLFAFLIRRLPEKQFCHKKKIFTVSRKEKERYEKLGIRAWKDKIPELGCFTKFAKRKVADPFDNAYVSRFLLESCYGTVIHAVTIFTGYLIAFLFPLRYFWYFAFPIATVNALLNLFPIWVLRYNMYKLQILYRHNERTAAKKREAEPLDSAA